MSFLLCLLVLGALLLIAYIVHRLDMARFDREVKEIKGSIKRVERMGRNSHEG